MALAVHSPRALQRPCRPLWPRPAAVYPRPHWRPISLGAASSASLWLSSRSRRDAARAACAAVPAACEGSSQTEGVLLITGGAASLAELCTPSNCRMLHVPGIFQTPQDVENLLQQVEEKYPGQQIAGLLHIGGALSSGSSTLASGAATEALDESLRSLTLLAAGVVPQMKQGARLLTWSSDLAFASPSTWSPTGGGMAALAGTFVEQYTQALAHQVPGCTIYGLRFSQDAMRALDAADPEARANLAREISELWLVPHQEAHGQIFPVGRPSITFSSSSARGASVLGCSLDVLWALRGAARAAAVYPVEGRPQTYQALAKALSTSPERLVWAHGASDVILRSTLAAAKRAGGGEQTALVQGPSWHNARSLLKAGGMNIDVVGYPDPLVDGVAKSFWQELREKMTSLKPALVYLVHPHFPTGVKEPGFAAQLRDLLGDCPNTMVAVDQTYLGFTELTEDDELLENLAQFNDQVVLIRSLSKVEGLAGLRLGYAKTTARTAELIAETLPFSGGLYISEMALEGALAAVEGPLSSEHRRKVLGFYREEQRWLRREIEALGLETYEAFAPFFVLRGPKLALEAVVKAGAAMQTFSFPREIDWQRHPAVCLVADRASNLATIRMLRKALEETGFPNWAEMLKPVFG